MITLSKKQGGEKEPTIALINIVFLMLIFFMVAGTLAPPIDPDLKLVDTDALEQTAPPDALVIHSDGCLSYRNEPVASVDSYFDSLTDEKKELPVRIVPDRALMAKDLVRLGQQLTAAGAQGIMIVAERGE